MENKIHRETSLGFRIGEELIHNNYLETIYNLLLLNRAAEVLTINTDNTLIKEEVPLTDALRFTDLLCKSHGHLQSYLLKQVGQQLLLLLIGIFPKDKRVSLFAESIFSSLGNFKGLESLRSILGPTQFQSLDLNEQLEISLRKEILRVPGAENEFFLPDQISIYNSLKQHSVSYSGPTSMGKSYIFRKFIADYIQGPKSCDFAIIVPSKALINETKKKILAEINLSNAQAKYKLVTSSNDLALQATGTRFIFVMTPERFVNLLSDYKEHKIGYIFIDEAQKIIKNDKRNAFYYKILSHTGLKDKDINYVFASPNIPNPDLFSDLLDKNRNLEGIKSIYSPVSQFIFLVNLKNGCFWVHNLLKNEFIKSDHSVTAGNLFSFIHLVAKSQRNLVYSNSKSKIIRYAREYSKRYGKITTGEVQDKRNRLANLIRTEIHGDYYLADLVCYGVAFHASFLPERFREKIESAFHDGVIHTIFCTSTLLEGVNLPADNLFVTSPKNGLSRLSSIGFKNLVGRSGRLEYNLCGNVYLICENDPGDESKYKDLTSNPVENQELSLARIKPKVKEAILKDIYAGDSNMPNVSKIKSIKSDDIELFRRLSRILVRDIACGSDSYLVSQFEKIDKVQILDKIKTKYPYEKTSESITISFEQEVSIDEAVKQGFRYPDIDSPDLYSELVDFLLRLNSIFKWDVFESNLLSSKIRHIAIILTDWIQGKGINTIIGKSIWYHKKHNSVYNPDTRSHEPFDGNNVEKKNWIIQDTLETLENTVLFSVANYFRTMSDTIKRVEGVQSFQNDWYEYVEFGSCNEQSIFLQKIGFSRDAAQKILKSYEIEENPNSDYLRFIVPKDIFTSRSEQIRSEANEVYLNMPEVFGSGT